MHYQQNLHVHDAHTSVAATQMQGSSKQTHHHHHLAESHLHTHPVTRLEIIESISPARGHDDIAARNERRVTADEKLWRDSLCQLNSEGQCFVRLE